MAVFCLFFFFLKKLLEAKLKNFESMSLAEEISRQPSIESVGWLFVVTLFFFHIETMDYGATIFKKESL